MTKEAQFITMVQTALIIHAAKGGRSDAPWAEAGGAILRLEEAMRVSKKMPSSVTPARMANAFYLWVTQEVNRIEEVDEPLLALFAGA